MTLEPVKCSYCGYRFRTDLEKIKEEGNAILVRGSGLSGVEKILGRKKAKRIYLDLTCPNCKKEFEKEVNT